MECGHPKNGGDKDSPLHWGQSKGLKWKVTDDNVADALQAAAREIGENDLASRLRS